MPPLALVTAPAEAEAVEQAKVWLNDMPSAAMRDVLRGLMDGPAAVLVARAVAVRSTHCGSPAEHQPPSESGNAGEATAVAKRDENFHAVGCIEDRPSQSLLQERTSASYAGGDDASRAGGGADVASHTTAVLAAGAGGEQNETQAVGRYPTTEKHREGAAVLASAGRAGIQQRDRERETERGWQWRRAAARLDCSGAQSTPRHCEGLWTF